ncbi:MAG TPA: DUF2927 domain-containing protein [Paracoccaceae bacterium]|nr:DUF2927 domain-containing protein [Paracoccaceae bacterium]
MLPLAVGLGACAPSGSERGDLFVAYQAQMQERGFLRTDRNPDDASYSNARLAENFRRIAFFTFPNDAMHVPKPLTRWQGPIRYAVLGTEKDQEQVDRLMARIARLTGLEIGNTPEAEANFVILLLDERERRAARHAFPDDESRAFFDSFLSAIFDCGAVADWTDEDPEITRALVYLHGDLQGLYRRLCFQEEITQSFGLFNDDPTVRPSIFNDDDEFALLTRHDEYLLRILYDPRLEVGMTEEEAMPVVHRIIRELRPTG